MTREHTQWIDATLDGSISEADFASLQQAMREHSEVFRHYRQQAELHGRLEWEFHDAPSCVPQADPPRPYWQLAAAALLVLSATLAGILAFRNQPTPEPTLAEAKAPEPAVAPSGAVAMLLQSTDAQWTTPLKLENSRLLPGEINLQSGSATILFDSGAGIALQGPSSLQVHSANHAFLTAGRATVDIPAHAIGFLLETPTASLSEQNSRFAVEVSPDGRTELHVLQGILELDPKRRDVNPSFVHRDRSVTIDHDDIVRASSQPFDSSNYPDLTTRTTPLSVPYTHWTFDQAHATARDFVTFRDSGKKPKGRKGFPARVQSQNLNASIAMVPGRFGSALQLNGQGAFVATNLTGVSGHQPRSVAFWVRISPDATNEFAYSILSWGSSTQGGKWQIGWNTVGPDGGVKGAIRTEVQGGFSIGSTDLRDGRWHHVASVFHGGEGSLPGTHISHYIDGRLESTSAFKNTLIQTNDENALPVVIGRRLEKGGRFKSFKGLLDEIYILPVALTPDQIDLLYRENRIDHE